MIYHTPKRFLRIHIVLTGEVFEVDMAAGKRAIDTIKIVFRDRFNEDNDFLTQYNNLEVTSNDPALAHYVHVTLLNWIINQYPVKVWAFDCEGNQFIDTFVHENLAFKWAKDHGLSIWNMKGIR